MYKVAALALSLLFGMGCPPFAEAQPPAPVSSSTEAAYLLGADDVVTIQVINFPELSVPLITVPPDGKITVPLLGSVLVAGRTTAQIARTLTAKWSDYVVDPSVTVTLAQRRRESVQVYGHVAHAQTIELKQDMRLLQALAEVGGVAEDGDLSQVTVTRKGGSKQTVDLSDPETKGGMDQDLPLASNDLIFVPERHTQVNVLGEVAKPGSYDYKEKMTVLDALKDADNINPATADLSQATLLHNGQESPLDLNALLHDGKLENNVMLAAGDRIFIPTLQNRIYVDGAVRNPGYYSFKPGDRLVDAISGTGGLLVGNSDLKEISVIHVNKLDKTASHQTVDIGQFYQKGDMTANIPLKPGDVVYVPLKGKHFGFGDVLQNLIGVGAVAGGVRAL